MLKGALPPTIIIAIHQSSAIANITLTIGYLSALIAVSAQALLPRAKFMKIIFFDLLSTCVAASLCCLAVFCAVKARGHNVSGNAQQDTYSSDACAVSAVWLIMMIWGANALRAWRTAELQDAMVAFSIFTCVTLTRAGTFVTVSDGLEFILRLLKGFMLGFAIATGVSLLVYPVTSRGYVFEDIRRYAALVENVLEAQSDFVRKSSSVWADLGCRLEMQQETDGTSTMESRKELQAAIAGLNALHAKLQADLVYSKDEIAWGKLSASDLSQIRDCLRNLFLPLSGMAMLPDILDMTPEQEAQEASRNHTGEMPSRTDTERVTSSLHGHLEECSNLVNIGLQYALLKLELVRLKHLRGRFQNDAEAGHSLNPMDQHFPAQYRKQVQEHHSRRTHLSQALVSPDAFAWETRDGPLDDATAGTLDAEVRQETFTALYILQLQDNLLKATQEFMMFAESKVADGTMSRNRVILPIHSMLKWLSITRQDSNGQPLYPNPEHLPAFTTWEKTSSVLPIISRFLQSPESIFGFRVAAASFCVGILAYLHQTQDFFIRQRCIWAMIVIVIGMSPTSGQTLFGFMTRIAATVVSLALSLMVWYIPDQHTAGVIVFLYLANVFEYYFYVTKPQLFGPSVIAIVTLNVIVGYELQIRKLGLDVGTSNGQPYYPIYLFGPYKLLAVAAGCAISFIWVIFPYPVTSKRTLRKSLGEGLLLLARFYSCMHASIELRMNEELRPASDARSAAQELQKSRQRLFAQGMGLLTRLRTLSHFTTFEPRIGGKFPREAYDAIINEAQRMFISMALMAQAAQSLHLQPQSPSTPTENASAEEKGRTKWSARLAGIALHSADFKSHATTSLLCHLGSAVLNAQPLPPYLSTGTSFPLARWVQQTDRDLMSTRHIQDPAFSAFVTLEVLRSVVGAGLGELLGNVKALVGELSFEFPLEGEDGTEMRPLMDGVASM
ncbi:uncharacterized protein DSM5745_09130 [Aspergillus mulundensis]|uniref:Uncharacterized protein n=1 Tax=Aspergillus mulundensis TaxID=1810919 RepID=A0A3D8R0A7_9EURO|nr:Uncharacterized protein DSM5745_09130 [Aspergillus mulundensis]RDW67264.1 Uncharacterized protein DSM5745_09130 [Aspergillus mulundensis]